MFCSNSFFIYLQILSFMSFSVPIFGFTISFTKYCLNETNPDTLPATGKESTGAFQLLGSENTFEWYDPGLNCSVTLTAPAGYQLLVSFSLIKLRNNLDSLIIMSENIERANLSGTHVCKKENCSALQFQSGNGQNITFHFISANVTVPLNYTGFKAVYTVFNTATGKFKKCKGSDRFLCLNARCISKELVCNGHNNCGDMSDEAICGVSTRDLVWGIVVIAIAVLSVMLLVPLFCFLASHGTQNIVTSVTVPSRATPLYSAVNDNETTNLLTSSGGRNFTDYWSSRSYERPRDVTNYGAASEAYGDKPSVSDALNARRVYGDASIIS